MNNEQMLAAVLALPDADLITASKIDDPIGAGKYYRADTVVQLLAAERERCAKAAEEFLTRGRSPLGRSVAAAIREAQS